MLNNRYYRPIPWYKKPVRMTQGEAVLYIGTFVVCFILGGI